MDEAVNNGLIGRTLNVIPWVQDTTQQSVWTRWAIAYRDVLILDAFNRPVGLYNLTAHDLLNAGNRATLKQMLLDAAVAVDSDGDGLPDVWETYWFESLAATPTGDDDADGADNLTEFTFATRPRDATSFPTVSPTIVRPAGRPALTINFRRFAGNSANVVVETSPDLLNWTAEPSSVFRVGSPVNLYDGTGAAQLRFQQTPAAGALPTGFLRVRAIPRPAG